MYNKAVDNRTDISDTLTVRVLEFRCINFPSTGAAADHQSCLNDQIIHCFSLGAKSVLNQSVEWFLILYSNQKSSVCSINGQHYFLCFVYQTTLTSVSCTNL